MITKEQLISIGISSDEADKIIAQQNQINMAEIEINKPEVIPALEVSSESITSIAQLSEYAKGQVVKLPDFAPGQPFIARLKRPSLMVLMKNGKIPNSLLGEASKLFSGDKTKAEGNKLTDPSDTAKMLNIMEVLAEAALVSPSYDEIKSSGVNLTDEQLLAIFNYTQSSIEDLKSFR